MLLQQVALTVINLYNKITTAFGLWMSETGCKWYRFCIVHVVRLHGTGLKRSVHLEMYPVLKESFRDMLWVFHTIFFGQMTFDVAAICKITQEEFIEIMNRIAVRRKLPLFSRIQFWVLLWIIRRLKMY